MLTILRMELSISRLKGSDASYFFNEFTRLSWSIDSYLLEAVKALIFLSFYSVVLDFSSSIMLNLLFKSSFIFFNYLTFLFLFARSCCSSFICLLSSVAADCSLEDWSAISNVWLTFNSWVYRCFSSAISKLSSSALLRRWFFSLPQMHSRCVIYFLSRIASSCSSAILLFEYSSAEMYLGLELFWGCWLVYLWEWSLFR